MVISHEHKYVFVECPLTASWAIRNELSEYYGGSAILHKHASYPEFARVAEGAEKDYFVFATVRNPLDVLVSRYVKLKTDHKNAFSKEASISRLRADYSDRKRYDQVTRSHMTFPEFFRQFCTRPYSSLIDIGSSRLNFVIRYERLQDDFSEVLSRLKLKQVRPLPVLNKTTGKDSWESYYTDEIIEQAMKVCAVSMKKWRYDFPSSWGPNEPSWANRMSYLWVSSLRSAYLLHLRYSDRPYARALRRMCALLFA